LSKNFNIASENVTRMLLLIKEKIKERRKYV